MMNEYRNAFRKLRHSSVAHRAKRLTSLMVAVATGVLLAACGAESVTVPDGNGTGARLRVINGSGQSVSVKIDGMTRIVSLEPGTVSTTFEVTPGARNVVFQSLANASSVSTPVVVGADGITTLTASVGGGNALVGAVLPDSGAIPAAGMSKLRVINMAASAPAVDVWRTQPDYPTAIRLMFPFNYNAASTYVQSTPGSWSVTVTPTSAFVSGDVMPFASALASLSVGIGANVARTMVILDVPGGGVKLSLLEN